MEKQSLSVPNQEASQIQLAVFDFDGVFTDNTVYVSRSGEEWVRCSRSDGLGLARLRSAGVIPWVLSTEKSPIVGIRCKKMGVEFRQGLDDKAKALENLTQELNIPLSRVAYLGNDINDLGCLKLAGVPIAVADAFEEILPHVRYITSRRGGFGAVREVCDWIVACKNTT